MSSLKTRGTVTRKARNALSTQAQDWLAAMDLLTAEEIGALLGIAHPGPVVRRWRSEGKLIAIPASRGHVYPAFQFDVVRRRVRPEIARANITTSSSCWDQLEYWAATDTAHASRSSVK